MRTPFDIYFKQDAPTDGPTGPELWLLPHTYAQIDIRIVPRLHYVQNEIIVGVGGDKSKRPLLRSMKNPFVKSGVNAEGSPTTIDSHYIDVNDRYHIKERVDRTKGNTYALGFLVETREPGDYPLSVEAMTDDGEGKAPTRLILHVETRPPKPPTS